VIDIRDLRLQFDNVKVLDGVTMKVPNNVVYVIMGPSGSGKSTILRVLNRLVELYKPKIEGEVYLDGQDIFKMPLSLLRRRVQMVFQIPNPIPTLSIWENVALGPKLNGLAKSKAELQERVRWALEKAQLWEEVKNRLDAPAASLSGGQQQRLCIARALAFRPEVLLMDEPTANLDPVNTAKIEELMLELKKEMTIVLVTHYPPQAARVGDRVAFLYGGKIVEEGPVGEVFTRPRHELTEKYVTGKI